MNMKNIYNSIFFVGAGGIGMSAIVRYFLAKGFKVGGYDRTESDLTEALIKEGAKIKYIDDINFVEDCFKDFKQTLVVYTPAIPESHSELKWFRDNGFKVIKRAALLGLITESERGICIAGTHGKTTTSSMTAHILKQSHVDCNAFLGGILKNYSTNLMLSDKSDLTVIEADEYDRSFHFLRPYMALITAADPDHLDIYGTAEAYHESFNIFTSLIQPGGTLIMKDGINIEPRLQNGVKFYTYSGKEKGDFHAENIRIGNGTIIFDFVAPEHKIKDIELGVPVEINIENGIGAIALSYLNGVDDQEIKDSMKSFRGAKRRFDFHIKNDNLVMIDDYAHHPDEIKASISSIKSLYPDKKISVIFQPHLFTRTRDFAKEFAKSLSLADEVILLDIYPARELPIKGVSSEIIFKDITSKEKTLCKKEDLLSLLENKKFEVLITLGAGDIDRLIEPIKELLTK
ncbi:MAG: UDP-N-acetylmuramate--L-alanine ligase [Bacteroidales bacterium]|nr:UDP-N-acetylmuramate--L-alanine ligase [Bacteroidales bacterium]